jgi:hypothetical protein
MLLSLVDSVPTLRPESESESEPEPESESPELAVTEALAELALTLAEAASTPVSLAPLLDPPSPPTPT